MPPSSNKRHLRDRKFCHHCLQKKQVSPNCDIMVPWYQYFCRVGGFAHNIVEGRALRNVFLTFKISGIQVLLQLQKGGRNFIKILGISLLLILTKPSCSNFVTAITNADVTSAIITSTLGTPNIDFNLQNREF